MIILRFQNLSPIPDLPVELAFDRDYVLSPSRARELAERLLRYAERAPDDARVEACNRKIQDELNRPCARGAWDARPTRQTFVYVMHDPHTGLVKIGRSTDPRVRESTLQSEKPSIKLLFFAPAPAALERQLHARYDDKRVRGEWFRLDPSEIEQIRQELCV